MNKYTERLVKEWEAYGKILIAVDYDSTISVWPTIDNTEDIKRTIQLLQVAYETGAHISINTCSKPDRHAEIQKHCEGLKIPIRGINVNSVDLPYGNHGKIYANIYLDDRAGLREALDILEEATYIIRGRKASGLTAGEHA